MKNRIYFIVLIGISLIAFALRFYKLGEVPYGFYQDESAIGYNAYSLMQTGRDEYGQYLPLYFKSFGDYKLPVYIYLTIAPIALFGLNEFAVRFPSAFFGFLTVILFYFLVKEMTKNRALALIAGAFLAINPWHLHYSRATFEVSIALFLFVLGTLLLYVSFERKKVGMFLIGTICFLLSLYTYNLTRLLSPILYFLIIIFYREKIKSVYKREVILTLIVSGVFLIPFLTTLFGNEGVASARGTLIFSSAAVQAPLVEFRSYFADLPSWFTKVFFNQWSLTRWQYFNNIVSYFSPQFFFVFGSTHGNHGIGNAGQLYLFEFPLFIIGIYSLLIRERLRWAYLILFWGFAVILVASLTREVPHATRSFFLIVPLELFSAAGFLEVLVWVKRIKNSGYRIGALVIIAGIVLYNLVFYFASYYVRFPIVYAKAWRAQDKDVSLWIAENQQKYDKIILDKEAGFIYTSFLFYSKYPPLDFQRTVMREPDDSEGFSMVKSFGKYEFHDINWNNDYRTKRTLIVTTFDRKPNDMASIKIFYYPKRPVVVSVKQNIVQYPVEEIAYVLVESK